MEGLRESSKAVGGDCLCSGWDPTWIPPRIQDKKPHRVKQFIVEPLVLFFCYVIKFCFWALLRSLGERDFFSSQCE